MDSKYKSMMQDLNEMVQLSSSLHSKLGKVIDEAHVQFRSLEPTKESFDSFEALFTHLKAEQCKKDVLMQLVLKLNSDFNQEFLRRDCNSAGQDVPRDDDGLREQEQGQVTQVEVDSIRDNSTASESSLMAANFHLFSSQLHSARSLIEQFEGLIEILGSIHERLLEEATRMKINDSSKSEMAAHGQADDQVENFTPGLNCAICLEAIPFSMASKQRCKHTFHASCIHRWLDDWITCPICRRLLPHPSHALSDRLGQ